MIRDYDEHGSPIQKTLKIQGKGLLMPKILRLRRAALGLTPQTPPELTLAAMIMHAWSQVAVDDPGMPLGVLLAVHAARIDLKVLLSSVVVVYTA